MKRAVIIVAGGKGLRIGGDLPKQFIPLNGKPVLMHTLEAFYRWDSSARLVLALPYDHQSYWKMLCRELNCTVPHRIAIGGETRFHSTRNALSEVVDCDIIGVHDGVRPFVSPDVIEMCFHAAEEQGAAMPVVPMIDSIREVIGTKNRSIDRNNFRIVQTPQVFRRDWLMDAYKQPWHSAFTDDASVVESFGKPICLIEGNRENIKITTPMDLQYAMSLIVNS